MTAGKINKDWFASAGQNGDAEYWFELVCNKKCEIDDGLSVWCGNAWLSQESIDDICQTIDKGI